MTCRPAAECVRWLPKAVARFSYCALKRLLKKMHVAAIRKVSFREFLAESGIDDEVIAGRFDGFDVAFGPVARGLGEFLNRDA